MREIVVAGQQTCRRFVRRPAGRVQPHFLAGGSLGRASRKYIVPWRWTIGALFRSNVCWQGENYVRIGGGTNLARLTNSAQTHRYIYMYTRWMDICFFKRG